MSVQPLRKSRVTPERIDAIEMRLTGCEQALSELPSIKADAAKAVENTTEILAVVKGGKSAVKFAQKHGGRVVAFAIGVATAKGLIGPEISSLFRALFGLQ